MSLIGRRRERLEETGHEPDPRFSFANERTFLAWIRTSLALIVAGLAVVQLLPPFRIPGGRHVVGLSLIGVGCVIAFTSYGRWARAERALRLGQALPRSRLAPFVAYAIAAVAVVAAFYALFFR